MLAIEVARMREGTGRLDQTVPNSALTVEDEYRVIAPVVLDAATNKDKENVRIAGRIRTTIELACSRCLEAFAIPVDAAVDLVYLPSEKGPLRGDEHELHDGDFGTAYYDDGVIDLADLVREQVYLALPMKPLCQDACKGLCPHCGTNLNSGSCACTTTWEDPRLAPLRAIARNNDDA